MTKDEQDFVTDLLVVFTKHGKGAFVGSVYDFRTRQMLTTCIVMDGIKREPFEQVEKGLTDLVNKIMEVSHDDRETSTIVL